MCVLACAVASKLAPIASAPLQRPINGVPEVSVVLQLFHRMSCFYFVGENKCQAAGTACPGGMITAAEIFKYGMLDYDVYIVHFPFLFLDAIQAVQTV